MNSNSDCGLKGSYKVDLFSGGKLVKSTEWFDNTITNSGLNYPFIYPFARCFMFLSLGGDAYGENRSSGTSLKNPINQFLVFDPTTGYYHQSGQYIGWEGYEIGGNHNETFSEAQSSACGTVFTNDGLNFHRGWTLPTGAQENGAVMAEDKTIKSFMVSPSRASDPSGHAAFSIVDREITIPSGYTATISYQLALSFKNYKNFSYFSGINDGNGFFDTGNASTGSNGSNENGLLSGWSHLSGIYRQVIPGIQIVDRMGACVIPTWGDQMEPYYRECRKLYFYLSPDMSQFATSQFGYPQNNESGAYNSNGLMTNYSQFASGHLDIDGSNITWPSEPDNWYYSGQSQQESSSVSSVSIPRNIRLTNLLPIDNYSGALSDFNYQAKGFVSPIVSKEAVAFATPGSLGINTIDFANYGQRAIYSTYLKTAPNSGLLSPTGDALGNPIRRKMVSRRASFSPIQSLGTNSRYGSMTLAYLSSNGAIGSLSFTPYVDFMFFDNSGKGADMAHYRIIPEIYLAERGSGVSNVKFDITGVGGVIPDSVKRFSSVYGFMDKGVNPSVNSSGLNTLNPLLVISPSSGYLFGGQVLSGNATGDYTYNGGTGWGSVYGVSISPDFNKLPYDACLVKNNAWSGTTFLGYSGQGNLPYPNPTGDISNLFWPVPESGIGLKISQMKYMTKMFGEIDDSVNDYFSNPNYQMIDDIIYTGAGLVGGQSTHFFDYTGALSGIGTTTRYGFILVSGGSNTVMTSANTSALIPFSGHVSGSGFENLWNANVVRASNYIQVTGFSATTGSFGYFKNWTTSIINGLKFNPSGYGLPNTGVCLAYVSATGVNGTITSISKIINSGDFSFVPSQLRKPSGVIHHVENIGASGFRLLPNYAYPNTSGVDYYNPVRGGSYPGLSMENGMNLFFDINWSGS